MKAVFLVLCSFGILMQVVGILAFGLSNEVPMEAIISFSLFTLLLLVAFNVSFSFVRGWAIQKLEGRKIAGGLPLWAWGVIVLVIILSLVTVFFGMAASWGPDMTLVMFGGGFLFATCWSVVMWFLCWKDGAEFFSEYEARVYFHQLGLSEGVISKEIARLRMKGLLTIVDVGE